jgi:hypothetical protein
MKKAITLLLVFLCSASMLMIFSPAGIAQAQSGPVQVVSYSWYKSAFSGDLIVVGEVQNTGPDILRNVVLTGTAYTVDGVAQGSSSLTNIYVGDPHYATGEFLPNQKAPFFMEFGPQDTVWQNMTWIDLGIDHIEFRIFPTAANYTTPKSYSDVRLVSPSNYVDAALNYTVTGVAFNYGTGYPQNVFVVASFYDATGKVIAVGFSNYLSTHYLAPNDFGQFILQPTEPTAAMATQIASYNLTVITSGTTTQPAATTSPSASPAGTTSSPTASGSPTIQPTNSQSSPESGESGIPMRYIFAIAAAVVIVVAVIVVAVLLRRNRREE